MELICPICGNTLTQLDKRFVCENRHSFDIARQGYVHLLPVQQKHSLAPGDTREQVLLCLIYGLHCFSFAQGWDKIGV